MRRYLHYFVNLGVHCCVHLCPPMPSPAFTVSFCAIRCFSIVMTLCSRLSCILHTFSPIVLKCHVSSLQEHHLALRSEGVKMIVDSQRPHFVGVDPDILSTGLVFYYLKVHSMIPRMKHMHQIDGCAKTISGAYYIM